MKKNDINNLEHIEKVLSDPENRYYLWGTGETGEAFYNEFHDKINIVGFIDSFTEDGETKFGLPVWRFEQVELQTKDIIIITIQTPKHISEVRNVLDSHGLIAMQNYFRYTWAHALIPFVQNRNINIIYCDLIITTCCTYKCKECIQLVPYVQHPQIINISEIKKNVDSAFSHVDRYFEYHIVGGEPLLHPDLSEIVNYIGRNYRKQIDTIVLVTNGTILPKQDVLNALSNWHVRIEISDYQKSAAAPKGQKIERLISLFEQHNISYKIRPMDLWMSYKGNTEEKPSESQLLHFISDCPCVQKTLAFYQNRAYICSRACTAEMAGLVDFDPANSLPLIGEKEDLRRKLLTFTIGITDSGSIPYCQFCYSRTPIFERIVPAAEQMNIRE